MQPLKNGGLGAELQRKFPVTTPTRLSKTRGNALLGVFCEKNVCSETERVETFHNPRGYAAANWWFIEHPKNGSLCRDGCFHLYYLLNWLP